jgi:uncharacterized protein YkwD
MATNPSRAAVAASRAPRAIGLVGALVVTLSTGHARAAYHDSVPRTSAASCPDTELRPTHANASRVETATLCLVNAQRARHGERVLRPNADLARSAVHHSEDMVSADYFDHVSPDGETLLDRIKASTYLPHGSPFLLGENIALGTLQLSTPDAIVARWMKSPGHRANILNAEFRDSGIGVVARAPSQYSNGQRGATYTQQFGAVGSR